MKGMILAAGFGTRLRPVTYTLPKPMVPLCNRPLVAWAVESFLAADVRELVINLHHLPEPIERYLRAQYTAQAELHFSFEEQILGTGGAIRRVRSLLEHDEAFFLVNGDTVQFPRWSALREALGDNLAALTLRHPPTHDRFTPVYLDGGQVTGFGSGRGDALMFAGSHFIHSRIFRHLPEEEEFGIVDRVYQPLLAAGTETLGGVIDEEPLWFDIGTPQRYLSASQAMLEAMVRGELTPPDGSHVEGDSLVHHSARGASSRSILGERTVLHGEVRDSIVWDDCTIDGTLDRCIVAHGVHVEGNHRDELITRDAPPVALRA
ncbi:MAG: sugar phosphate nucleotidyltransferase [Acidobacteriota bacterium]